jgi:peptidoglycan/xylan/chitin deacetylase (PgdA/CDA1 family)
MRARANTFELERIESASATMGPQPKSWLYHLIRRHSAAELERLCQALQAIADRPVQPPSSARALSWDDVRALDAGGVEIGAHTTSHCVLTHLPGHDVEADLRRSREAIENALGKSVRHFAYCNGYYNETVIAALKRTGYMSAVTTEDRLNRLGDDPFRIGRRVLWEKSAWGTSGQLSRDLLACQLDDAWSTLGFDASESGQRPEPSKRTNTPHEERRLG